MSQDSGEQDPPGPDGPAPSLAARLAARGAEAEPRPPAGRPSGSIDIEFSSGAAVTLDADGRPAAFADEAARPGAQADAPGDAPPAAPGDAQPPAPGPAADAAPAPGPPRRPTRRSRLRTVPDLLTESLTHLPVVKEVVPKSRRAG